MRTAPATVKAAPLAILRKVRREVFVSIVSPVQVRLEAV
jgi:hypothetical protein